MLADKRMSDTSKVVSGSKVVVECDTNSADLNNPAKANVMAE